ncbi:unnamed protein product [Parnassius apollo]|uniref:(apollo) hypothetical protein n=1 Tax=Parnassius apollo TaxID=110799 RepID=A0A8S3XRT2_PARAO|nr:unnamed protein product [Parnassius apollo]
MAPNFPWLEVLLKKVAPSQPGEKRIEDRIAKARALIGRLTSFKSGNNRPRIMRTVRMAFAGTNINLFQPDITQKLTERIDDLKQKIAAWGKRIRRFSERSRRFNQNRLFQSDQKRLYKTLERPEVCGAGPGPDQADTVAFWRGLWSEPVNHSEGPWMEVVASQSASVTPMDPITITPEDVAEAVRRAPNWKSPGLDGLHHYWLKVFVVCHAVLARQFQEALDQKSLPSLFTTGITHLVPKDQDTTDPSKYRPITSRVVRTVRMAFAGTNISLCQPDITQKLTERIDDLKQKIAAWGKRIRRFSERSRRFNQNRLFQSDQKRLYKSLERPEVCGAGLGPDQADTVAFWRGLWSEPVNHSEGPWMEVVASQSASVTPMDPVTITPEDVAEAVRRAPNWKSPGLDGLHHYWLKGFVVCHAVLARQYQEALDQRSLPSLFTTGITHLVPKDQDTTDPSKYRPITYFVGFFKMANRRWTGSDDQISAYIAYLDGNESEDGAEEDESEENDEEVQTCRERADLLRILEDEREEDEESPTLEQEGPGPDPAEEDPSLLEDPQTEQEPGVHSVQARRQEMRKLLWKKQSMWTSEDDVAFFGQFRLW